MRSCDEMFDLVGDIKPEKNSKEYFERKRKLQVSKINFLRIKGILRKIGFLEEKYENLEKAYCDDFKLNKRLDHYIVSDWVDVKRKIKIYYMRFRFLVRQNEHFIDRRFPMLKRSKKKVFTRRIFGENII